MDIDDIRAELPVEDLVEGFPASVDYLREAHGLRVICCGAPVWATLGQIARSRGLEPDALLDGLREYLAARARDGGARAPAGR